MKYGIMNPRYDAQANYGDYIQKRAIEYLYEYIGIDLNTVVKINEGDFLNYHGDEKLIVPINAPFWGRYQTLSDNIIPVYLGISITNNSDSVIKGLRFAEYEPVGCRDQRTYELLSEKGIKCYLNGCMTIALPVRNSDVVGSKVFVVDCCNDVISRIPKELMNEAVFLNQVEKDGTGIIDEAKCRERYEIIRNEAKLVITSRLHVASPAVAFGIPTIFASQFIPHRCVWLKKYISLYDHNDFDAINWYPPAANNEAMKRIILENAKSRVLATWNHYSKMDEITGFYYDKDYSRGMSDDMWKPIEWMKENWENRSYSYKYVLWGATQTLDNVKGYIEEFYPNAELIAIIDEYKHIEIDGIYTVKKDIISYLGNDVAVFVTAERASGVAREYLDSIGHSNYCICWTNANIA